MSLIETFKPFDIEVDYAQGDEIIAKDGTRYLDFYGGHAVAILGHCHAGVNAAIREQSESLTFYSAAIQLDIHKQAADAVSNLLPEGVKNFFFCNSGAEANENALKLAIRKTGRQRLAAFKGSFHGRTLLCTAVTDEPGTHAELGAWIGNRVDFLNPNDFLQLESLTKDHAAIILEPIQSMAGIFEFHPDYLQALRLRCTELGIWLIFDEIQTGLFRCEAPYLSGQIVTPDIITSAKGLGNGYPVGMLAISDAIRAQLKPNDLGSTFGGGPTAMAAVKAVADALSDPDLQANVASLELGFKALTEIEGVVEVRGKGCLIGVQTTMPAAQLQKELLQRGIIVGTSKQPNTIRLMPPLNMPAFRVETLRSALTQILS
ncbi:MAG TPA: aspartate aminotransferase family protein [Fimbriimonas sp.]|nr:aspartate aminotransferase family protein [Fimbriimonas sp.]